MIIIKKQKLTKKKIVIDDINQAKNYQKLITKCN